MLLTRPTPEQSEALRLLTTHPGLRPLLQYLREEAGATIGNLMTVPDEVMMRQMQGKAKFLHDLLTAVDKSAQ